MVIISWITIGSIQHKKLLKSEKAIFEAAFSNMEEGKPHYFRTSSYGHPFFQLTFRSEQQMASAEQQGLITKYKNNIQDLHDDSGFLNSKGIQIGFIGQIIEIPGMKSDGKTFTSRMNIDGIHPDGSPNYRILDGKPPPVH